MSKDDTIEEIEVTPEMIEAPGVTERLAEILFDKMQHLASLTDYRWQDLSAHDRDFYITSVEELAIHPRLIRSLLEET